MQQIVSINGDVDPDHLAEGQTILLPSGKLSSRDKEILDGIGTAYRVYPVRKGEALTDIISKRSITREEMAAINPGVNLDKLKGARRRRAARPGPGIVCVGEGGMWVECQR